VDGNVVRRVVVTLDATMNTATVLTRSQAVQVAQAILATRYSFADIRDRDRARLAHPAHKETSPGTPIAVGTIGKNPVRPVLPRLHYPQGIEYKGRHEPLISENCMKRCRMFSPPPDTAGYATASTTTSKVCCGADGARNGSSWPTTPATAAPTPTCPAWAA
jgi:hypothetical protein